MKMMFARLFVLFAGLAYLTSKAGANPKAGPPRAIDAAVAADARELLQKGRKRFRLTTYGSEVYSDFLKQDK